MQQNGAERMVCAREVRLPWWVPKRAFNGYRRWRAERLEREHLEEFQRFYRTLENKDDILYVFFTSNLLHWCLKTIGFVPPEVNLVLLGCDLSPEERSWIEARVPRPFHHLRERVDDKTVWEFLFRTNEANFGWLDVDCMVTNPDLFAEMRAIPPDAAINCVWSYKGLGDLWILSTHFLFLNARVIAEARRRGLPASPCTFNYEGTAFGREEGAMSGRLRRLAVSRLPTRAQVRLLARLLPFDNRGRPAYPSLVSGYPCFDTLVMYQLTAHALGFRLNRVRELNGLYDGSPDLYFADHDFAELVHPGGVSWYRQLAADPQARGRYLMMLQAERSILAPLAADLPPQYRDLLAQLDAALTSEEITPQEARERVSSYLLSKEARPEIVARLFEADP